MALPAPVLVNTTVEAHIFQFPSFAAEDAQVVALSRAIAPAYTWPSMVGPYAPYSGYVNCIHTDWGPEQTMPWYKGGEYGLVENNASYFRWGDRQETDSNSVVVIIPAHDIITVNGSTRFAWQQLWDSGTPNPGAYITLPTPETYGTPYFDMGFIKKPQRFKRLDSFSIPASYWRLWDSNNGAPLGRAWQLQKLGAGYAADSLDPKDWSITADPTAQTFSGTISPQARPGVYKVTSEGTSDHGHVHRFQAVFEVLCMTATITATPLP